MVLVRRAENNMDIKEKIKNLIREVLEEIFSKKILDSIVKEFTLEHPADFDNGDYSTNVAMVYFSFCRKEMISLSKDKIDPKRNSAIYDFKFPKQFADIIKSKLEKKLPKEISKIEIAGPGFINFYLSREFFVDRVKNILEQKENFGKNEILAGKKVMVEYTQPNPFKPFHIGHLMSNAIGESTSRIFEFSGAEVIRANYEGDVGLHVAKAIYSLVKRDFIGFENLSVKRFQERVEELKNEYDLKNSQAIAAYIGICYQHGNTDYETNEDAKREIDAINKKIYEKSDEKINQIYTWGRRVTLEAFEEIYKTLGTKFDKYYFESEVIKIGEEIVQKNIPAIFEKSDGAVVFHGEKYDPKLHTRVFLNSQGLPTYETKELGLTRTKFKKQNLFSKGLDLSVVTTAVEQAEYMKVVQKVMSLIYPRLEAKMKHITHGMMRLAHMDSVLGVASSTKMSSRKGNVVTGEELLHDSMDVVLTKIKDREFTDVEKKNISEIVGVAALKYSILRSSLNSDIIYDFEKSISFDGDSGPYLQYTVVRANSILNKAKEFVFLRSDLKGVQRLDLYPEEVIALERTLYQFGEVVERSYQEFAPHYIATYLTQLSSDFNSFYANTQILDEKNKYAKYHLELVKAFSQVMKNGLYLLGIEVPEKM